MEYTELQEKYGGQFVAWKGDHVVANADTHGELVRALEEKDINFTEVSFEFIRAKGQIYAL